MAAGAKAKTTGPSNGAAPKAPKPKLNPTPSPSVSGAATPLSEDAPKGAFGRATKPDKKQHEVEQEAFKVTIAEVQAKMVRVTSSR